MTPCHAAAGSPADAALVAQRMDVSPEDVFACARRQRDSAEHPFRRGPATGDRLRKSDN